MNKYFNDEHAIAVNSGGKIETVLETIASRYMGANPRYDYAARPFVTNAIVRNKDYRYEADFSKIFPDAPDGSYVYTWGKYRAEADGELKFTIIPKGPVKIWMNGEKVFNTTFESERYCNSPITFNIPVIKGWNHIVLRFTRTAAGFGAEFGTWLGKLCYYFFKGQDLLPSLLTEGFDYTRPMPAPLENPSPENLGSLCVPPPSWTGDEKSLGVFGRIFPEAKTGDKAVAKTEIFLPMSGEFSFYGTQNGNFSLYAGTTLIKFFKEAGSFKTEHKLKAGRTVITVVSTCNGTPWDFTLWLQEVNKNNSVSFNNLFYIDGGELPWIFAGPFKHTTEEELVDAFDRELLAGKEGEKTFWRLDMPYAWVRLYNDNPLYGHWNYPLGVTLYGLIETARLFEKDIKSKNALGTAIGSYVEAHGAKSIRTLDYALFDKEHFGGATAVHHLLTSIDSLDDCGSFGSLILELAKDRNIGSIEKAADYVAYHILNKQDRREEGCFWRREMMHHFHNGTLWADDLYMSVPFLCRYAKLKNDPSVLDTAVLQFEGFKKYLYMEDKKLMAHVFDFGRNMNTGIPWGRGNGWTIFSLTELLMVLPDDHPKRQMLIDFFNDLAAGFLSCQDENGMWHQVLNMPSSYIETSCTAMFICAFSRGIRYWWFKESTGPYRIAAFKAWKALEKYSIDKEGNIHGVCRGSEFAFNPNYYAEHLLPRLNDTHGIGIVLLAGVELLKL